MVILDRVKFDGLRSRDWLIYKYPSEQLVFGTQLIVNEGQFAVFVKGGTVCDIFSSGTYTLDTDNMPILKSIMNIPFGGRTSFSAEIYYLNTTSKLDLPWGTSFDVYEGAAINETGAAGALLAGGVGVGAGISMCNHMDHIVESPHRVSL